MLSIAHATTGALIATKISNPLISIPLILLSHYFLDAISHWDVGTGLSNGSKNPKIAFLEEIPDFLLGFLLIYLWFQSGPLTSSISGLTPYWGGLVGLLPDFLEAPRNFWKKEPKLLKIINRFHHNLHHSIPRPLAGIAPQLILLYLIYILK